MAILAMCPDKACGELFEVPDSAVGTEVRCPACGKVQVISVQQRPRSAPVYGGEEPGQVESEGESPRPAAEHPQPRAEEPEDDEIDFGEVEPDTENGERIELGDEEEAPFLPVRTRREVRSLYAKPRPTSAPPRPAPSKPGERFLVHEDLPADDALGGLVAREEPEEDKQENKLVVVAFVAVGGIGLLAGLLTGTGLGGEWKTVGALVGAGVGWVIGVLAAFMLILAHPKDEVPKVRCLTCGNVFPAETDSCRWCGAKLPPPDVSPLTAGCLNSHNYAVSNARSAVTLATLVAIPAALIVGGFRLPEVYADAPAQLPPVLTGVSILLAFLVGACWLRYFLTVAGGTLVSYERAPDAPKIWDLHNIVVGVKGLGVAALYVVPLFTIPLLPLAMLRLAAPRQVGVYDPVRNTRAALNHARDFAVMWLWVLLWLAAMAFSMAVAVLLFNLKSLIPEMEPQAELIVRTLLLGGEIAMIAGAACVCGTAVFRCIGLFGRQNARELLLDDSRSVAPAAGDDGATLE